MRAVVDVVPGGDLPAPVGFSSTCARAATQPIRLRTVKTISDETRLTTETSGGVLVGTLRYMSPEQLQGEAPGPAFDLWALSVVTYECLPGVLPAAAKTPAEWTQAVTLDQFTPIAQHLPSAPEAWQRFFDLALSLEPQRRPPTAHDWYESFQRSMSARPAAVAAT